MPNGCQCSSARLWGFMGQTIVLPHQCGYHVSAELLLCVIDSGDIQDVNANGYFCRLPPSHWGVQPRTSCANALQLWPLPRRTTIPANASKKSRRAMQSCAISPISYLSPWLAPRVVPIDYRCRSAAYTRRLWSGVFAELLVNLSWTAELVGVKFPSDR
jgi:hypothetical protein